MENKILIHKEDSYLKILSKYILALIPLILYGLYKNGIVLYLNQQISFIAIFRPLIFPLLGLTVALIVNLIKKKELINTVMLNGLLIGMVVPLQTNIFLFAVFTFGFLYAGTFIEKKLKFNIVCLIKLLLMVILFLLNSYDYANAIEVSNSFAYSFIDIIFGRQIGGVASSSVIWIVISGIYLITDYYYKKEIPIFAYLSYAIVCCLSFIFTKDLNLTLTSLVASTPLFCFMFIAPIMEHSPYTSKGKIAYGVLIGVTTSLLCFITKYEAPFIAILIFSTLYNVIDNMLGQKITK